MSFFLIVYMAVVLQRLLELRLASRNARYLRSIGGYEVGADHYKYIVFLHVGFFAALLAEGIWRKGMPAPWWPLSFSLFLFAQILRYWCILTLGKRWNTRIIILPGAPPITRGPYRYIRHPNYWIVTIELFTLPLTFSAYVTAMFFTICNLWLLLRVRIPAEERAVYKHR
ncbi:MULTISPECIES: isoprenylcysteine carboxyl methyltransferase family protein [Brevibacillus]|uniref:isoprenylcysteine carboxyl methyltransferase family protein n=1 Tax=Brevibacillus TaxID=55080 RepID=UPI00046863FD|nr:isoprenylcysteine carboxylmethyltransferase family protein [Brevibacillus borstelensis]MCC0564639.1 hypothetical protein [Brevibacillus borstelensis]MCM3470142.1 hypothetical protein [Brevibacillus borstelensis]MCM3557748.1 hypothetical protein [Brevibacillus borstelensis]MCM3589045.1 hypothetical protein [Brevibacillus borstelensis]